MARTVYDKLRALQDVLSRKFEVEREIQEIPKSLATKTELLNRLKKSLADAAAARQ
jgi:predicted  nucleic acid-binding Zn-ribbon protein